MSRSPHPKPAAKTSWEPIDKWYHGLVGEEGHYYHRNIILPGVLRLLDNPLSVLDLACGTGVLARRLPDGIEYFGVDASPSLIQAAKGQGAHTKHVFMVGDITHPLKLQKKDFSHTTIILAVQNIENPEAVFLNAAKHLAADGSLILVMNHPCFRIPRQSSWGIDEDKKLQYRRLDRYMSQMKIPIQAHPGKGTQSPSTFSFHHPLSAYTLWLHRAGLAIAWMEEWCSDKISTGKNAKMENRSREEFPLFLAIKAIKTSS